MQNLHALGSILDNISKETEQASLVRDVVHGGDPTTAELYGRIISFLHQAKNLTTPIELRRGTATMPLKGIDVPFHSAHLLPGVKPYRKFLQQRILDKNIYPERMIGKFFPNVIGQPFSLDDRYVREVCNMTGSPVLKEMLG